MAYTKTNWQDLPNTTTPINATNLNKIENELEALDIKMDESLTFRYIGEGVDLNDYKSPGVFGVYNCINQPPYATTNLGSLVVIKYSSDWLVQLWYEPDAKPVIWQRSWYAGSTWSSWQPITNSNYSTSELAIGTWVDGKTLYRKCVAITLPNNSQTYVATNIRNANIVRIDGYATSGSSVIPLVYNNLIYTGGAYAYVQDGGATLYIGCNFNGSNYTGYAILEYTKN